MRNSVSEKLLMGCDDCGGGGEGWGDGDWAVNVVRCDVVEVRVMVMGQ